MLKRCGKLSAKDLANGELANKCAACPHPGINIPQGWEDHPNRYDSIITRLHSYAKKLVNSLVILSMDSFCQGMAISNSSGVPIVLGQERIRLPQQPVVNQ